MVIKPSVLASGTGSKPPLLLDPKPDELELDEPDDPELDEPDPDEPDPDEPDPDELELPDELDPEPEPEPEPELELELELELEEDEELELLELEVRQQVGQKFAMFVIKEAFETELFTL